MKEKYTPGEGCECSAYSESECGCDVDWTPREVYELRDQRDMLADQIEANHKGTLMLERMVYQLREQRDMLAEALRNLMFYSEGYRMESYDKTIQEAEAALASVKGGSHE
jgi:hypothetical protein